MYEIIYTDLDFLDGLTIQSLQMLNQLDIHMGVWLNFLKREHI